MSKLISLKISGLRSFGIKEEDTQTIKFFTPMTLFLGQNGCGKTTIIEAIKHACTGDLPGGTNSGQGFVSDPYLHRITQCKGKVLLAFNDIKGNFCTIARVLSCEKNRNNTLKFSTLDSTIKYINRNGEQVNLSGRIQDLNVMAIDLLGVPPAILNNVIFCHQEDSLWPLGEGGAVKKKFDAIFDSVKYDRATDTLKKLLKKKSDRLKICKLELEHKKGLKETAYQIQLKLENRIEKLNDLSNTITLKTNEIIPIDVRLEEIYQLEINLSKLQSQMAAKESELRHIKESQMSLKSHLKTEFAGTDEDLQNEINNFGNNQKKEEKKLKDLNEEKNNLAKSEKELSEIIKKQNVVLAQIREELKTLRDKKVDRNLLIKNMCNRLKILPDLTNEFDDAERPISIIKEEIQNKQQELNNTSEKHLKEEKILRQKVDSSKSDCEKASLQISFKKQEIFELQKQLREIETKLKDIDVSDEKLGNCERKIASIEKDLNTLKNSFNEENLIKSIDTDKQEIKKIEDLLENLDEENKILQKNSIVENQLENLTSLIKTKETEIFKIKSVNHDKFELLFTEIPEINLKDKVEKLQKSSNLEIMEINNQINYTQKQVTTQEMEIKHLKKSLESSRLDLQKNKNLVQETCGDFEYEEKRVFLEKTKDKTQKEKGQLSSAIILYESFIQKLRETKRCPVCTCDYETNESTLKEIISALQSNIQQFPQKLSEAETALNKTEREYRKVLELKPINISIKELTAQCSEYENKIKNVKKSLLESSLNLSNLQSNLKKPQQIYETCVKVISSAALIDQYITENKQNKNKIEELKLQILRVESNFSKQQIEAEIDSKRLDLSELRQKCEKNQKKLNLNSKRMQDLRDEKNKWTQEQIRIQGLMQGKPQLEERKMEINTKQEYLEKEIINIEISLADLLAEQEEIKLNLETTLVSNRSCYETLNKEFHSYEADLRDIIKVESLLKDLIAKNLDVKFNNTLTELTMRETKIKEIVKQKECTSSNIENIRILLTNQEHQLRILNDNKSLRMKKKQEGVVEEEIQELKKQIGNQNYRSVLDEKKRLQKNKNDIENSIQVNKGKMQELENSIKDFRTDLEKPEYKNATKIYRKQFLQTKVLEKSLGELKLYTEALENSVCKFHKSRMVEINKNIRDLWRSIYKGNDIDFIEIDTEINFTGSKRQYKYRVMAMRSDTLIEMRGRCSAGQKVLASLIIRIALSEAFSKNCGILALDEPTTNLDREHIQGLSDCLADIVNTRRAQTNFQLIVITHDEEFLTTLRRVDSLKNYYEVSRNARGNSVVTLKSI